MCSPATCRKCGKTGWAGCGRHVDRVLAGVPTERRCTCQASPPAKPAAGRTRRWSFRSR